MIWYVLICISVKPFFFVLFCLKWFSVAPVQELPESLEAQLLLQMRQLRADTRAAETRLKAQEKQIKEDKASLKSITFLKVSNSFLSKDCGDEDFLIYLYPRMSTVQVVQKKQPPVLEAHLALLNRILAVQELPFPCWIRRKHIFHCHTAHQGELGTAFCSPEETPCLPPRVREAISLDKDSWPWNS